jgi:hypothetical protein
MIKVIRDLCVVWEVPRFARDDCATMNNEISVILSEAKDLAN